MDGDLGERSGRVGLDEYDALNVGITYLMDREASTDRWWETLALLVRAEVRRVYALEAVRRQRQTDLPEWFGRLTKSLL